MRPLLHALWLPALAACGGGADSAAPQTAPPPTGPFADLPVVDATISSPGPKTCANPVTGPPLTEAVEPSVLPEQDPASWATEAPILAAEGVAVGDFNGDGAADVLRPTRDRDIFYAGHLDEGMYRLTEVDTAAWLPDDPATAFSQGAIAADADDDGDLDVFLPRWDLEDLLLINDGSGTFRSSSAARGPMGTPLRATLGAAWGDADSDGDLDLLVLATGAGPLGPPPWQDAADFEAADPNLLLRNDGPDAWSAGALPDLPLEPYSCCAAWVDLDDDHDRDLLVVNDFGPQVVPNLVLLQEDGELVRQEGSGLDLPMYGMGLAVGDLNADLAPDFVAADWGRVWLTTSDGAGGWADATRAVGLEAPHPDSVVAWGNALEDVDNDGDLDLWQAFGYLDVPQGSDDSFEEAGLPNPRLQPDALFLQGDDGSFEDAAAAWGLDDDASTRGGVWTDLNRDGVLDLVVARMDGPMRLHLSQCTAAGWLTVQLRQPAPNTRALGARVLVEEGDWQALRYLQGGGVTLASSGPAEAHLGLGDRDAVDRLTVVWPDGTRSVFEDVAANQHLTITRAE